MKYLIGNTKKKTIFVCLQTFWPVKTLYTYFKQHEDKITYSGVYLRSLYKKKKLLCHT